MKGLDDDTIRKTLERRSFRQLVENTNPEKDKKKHKTNDGKRKQFTQ